MSKEFLSRSSSRSDDFSICSDVQASDSFQKSSEQQQKSGSGPQDSNDYKDQKPLKKVKRLNNF